MTKLTEGTLFANRYLFKRLLGRGGFSEVWLATDNMTGLDIAVKVYAPGQGMDTDGMTDFCKELSNVYNLNHTNLLKPQHVDNWEGMPYLVMTFCQKGSCHRLIGTMSEAQIWNVLHDVAAGLAYLHEQGIIHQDIKPDNILVDNAGHYVITDFGISVKSRSTLRKSMNVSTGNTGGTTAYMGPERFSADPTPLKASDIWSLGATLYELITGNTPFGEIGGGMQKNGADLPTIKQNISMELRTVLARMLSKETWNRPTAEQLAQWGENSQQINNSEHQTQIFNSQQFIPTQTPKEPNRKIGFDKKKIRTIAIICASVLLVAAIWGIIHYEQTHESQDVTEEKMDGNKAKELHVETGKYCQNCIHELTFENWSYDLPEILKTLSDLEEVQNIDTTNLRRDIAFEQRKLLIKKLSEFKDKYELIKDDGAIPGGKADKGMSDKISKLSDIINKLQNNTPASDIYNE